MKDPFQEAVRARLETVSSSDGHLTVPVDPEKIADPAADRHECCRAWLRDLLFLVRPCGAVERDGRLDGFDFRGGHRHSLGDNP